jgi:signal transduction histidine kinase/ActR/RegA family two-component response regulator
MGSRALDLDMAAPERSPAKDLAVTAALVMVGCALGACAGIWLRFANLGAAVLYVPYALVTAALLRTRPRHWPVVLLAATAGSYAPHRYGGASVGFVLLAELVNHARAILAAIGLRRFAAGRARLESLRGMVTYLVIAVFVAPGAAAFGGAAVVSWLRTSPRFWLIWQQWWLSNALTGLILLPLLTFEFRRRADGLRISAARFTEGLLLAVLLLATGTAVFANSYDNSPTHPAHLYWALPFLLWAAVRFGPRPTSAALLGVTMLSIWGAIGGRGPFAPHTPSENLLELQVFLLAVSTPVMLLASLIKEQRRTATILAEIEARKSVEAALRESNRRKDEFLAMLGHELRNPLAPISIALQILREAPPDSQDAAWARDSIGRQLGHMTRLLDDLLDISRVTLGKIQLQMAPVDVSHVVSNAVEATRSLVDSSGHRLTVTLPNEPVVLRGDAVRLTQVVSNLINNAAKYTERGGSIDVAVAREGADVRLSVRDNGIGIAADALERIFDLFSQLPGGHERAQGGLGVGLTLARRLVELHGGTLEARSDGVNRGAELIVRLPAVAEDARTTPPPAAPPVQQRGAASLRILAVDDNVHMAQALASILRMWGHSVRTAHDGATALELATQWAPEVVLLDLSMPRLDGLEVARRLRQRQERSPLLMVSMSGFGQEDTRRHSGEAGFHHHLTKPFEMSALRVLLDDCLRARSAAAS